MSKRKVTPAIPILPSEAELPQHSTKLPESSNAPTKMSKFEKRARLVALRAAGQSYREIAAELDITAQTAKNWADDLQTQIREQRSMDLDDLYKLTLRLRAERIKIFSKTLNTLWKAMIERTVDELKAENFSSLIKAALELEARLSDDFSGRRNECL